MFLTSTSETLRSLEKAQFVVREDRVRRVPLGGGVLYTASGTLVSYLWNQKL